MDMEFSWLSIKRGPEQLKMVATADQADIPTCIFPQEIRETQEYKPPKNPYS